MPSPMQDKKCLTEEFGLPKVISPQGWVRKSLSEEHGQAAPGSRPNAAKLRVGDKVELIPTHGCTTINLHDEFHVIRDGSCWRPSWPIAGATGKGASLSKAIRCGDSRANGC